MGQIYLQIQNLRYDPRGAISSQNVHIRSAHNLADVLTKAIKRGVLRALRDKLLGYEPYTDEDALAHSEEKNSD